MGSQAACVSHEEFIDSTAGVRLCVRSWLPVDEPRALLAVVPGFHSHGGYYQRFAETLAHGGVATFAVDLRGRGKSTGTRSPVVRFTEYVDDVAALVSHLRARHAGPPVFLSGHGAGGVAAALHAVAAQRNLAGLICESLALEMPVSRVKVQILAALAQLAPGLPAPRLRGAYFSRDPQVLGRMAADPLIRREPQPARALVELFRASSGLRASLESIRLPLLILHGSADRIALPSGSEFFHNVAASRDKTLQIFEGYYHDLINDRGHEHVVARIHEWIVARLGSAGQRAQIGISFINNGS